jgi:hypothetical protein
MVEMYFTDGQDSANTDMTTRELNTRDITELGSNYLLDIPVNGETMANISTAINAGV